MISTTEPITLKLNEKGTFTVFRGDQALVIGLTENQAKQFAATLIKGQVRLGQEPDSERHIEAQKKVSA